MIGSYLPEGILEIRFKKEYWLVKNGNIWLISLALKPSFLPPLNFLHDYRALLSNFVKYLLQECWDHQGL